MHTCIAFASSYVRPEGLAPLLLALAAIFWLALSHALLRHRVALLLTRQPFSAWFWDLTFLESLWAGPFSLVSISLFDSDLQHCSALLAVLRNVATPDTWVGHCRGTDFLWLLPAHDQAASQGAVLRLRQALTGFPVPVLLGCVQAHPHDCPLPDLLHRALQRAQRRALLVQP